MLFFCIEPDIFAKFKVTTTIYAVANLVIFLFFIIKMKSNKYKISNLLYLWIIYRIYLLFMMVINSNYSDLDKWGYLSLMVSNLIFVFEYSIKKNNIYNMLSAGVWLNIIYLLVNLISLYYFSHGIIPSKNLYSNGDGDFYFLGIKIKYTVYIFAAVALTWTYYKKYDKKKEMMLVTILSIWTIFKANISTAIVCMIFLIVIYMVMKKKIISVNLKGIILITILVNVAIIGFNAQNLFSGFIENYLHKSVTLTGRTDIWKGAISVLKSENILILIFGNGIFNDGSFVPFGGTYWPAHNQWLQNIYELGIIGTMGFCFFISFCDKNKENRTNLNKFILCVCATILFGTVTNTFFSNAPIYIPFIILNYIHFFNKETNYEKSIEK